MSSGYSIVVDGSNHDLSELLASSIYNLAFEEKGTGVYSFAQKGGYIFQNNQPIYHTVPYNFTALRGSTNDLYKSVINTHNQYMTTPDDLFWINDIIGKFAWYDTVGKHNVTIPAWARSFRAIIIGGGGGGGGGGGMENGSLWKPGGGGGGGGGEMRIYKNSINPSDTLEVTVGAGGGGGTGGPGSYTGGSPGSGSRGGDGAFSLVTLTGSSHAGLSRSAAGGEGGGAGLGSSRFNSNYYPGTGSGGAGGDTFKNDPSHWVGGATPEENYNGQSGGYIPAASSGGHQGGKGGLGNNGGRGLDNYSTKLPLSIQDNMVLRLDGNGWGSWRSPKLPSLSPGSGGKGGDTDVACSRSGADACDGYNGENGNPGLVIISFFPGKKPPDLPSIPQ